MKGIKGLRSLRDLYTTIRFEGRNPGIFVESKTNPTMQGAWLWYLVNLATKALRQKVTQREET